MTAAEPTCPVCASPVATGDTFCEACGAELHGGLPAPAPSSSGRDHWSEQPVSWVAGVCDKGIVHDANEDAMALAAASDRPFAVVVVCDGVTSAPHSDRAALAASRAACDHLAAAPASQGAVAAAVTHWAAVLQAATTEASSAAVAVAHALGDPAEPPSCTYVAAVVCGALISVAWCGDSRAYWFPDAGDPRQLTVDHSLGTELIAAGTSPAEAERDPAFHTITRWLGADAVDHAAELTSLSIDGPGWLLVCSDGLWNYAAALDEMAARVADVRGRVGPDPLPMAAALVEWANAEGGHDNITAALARCDPSLRWEPEGAARG